MTFDGFISACGIMKKKKKRTQFNETIYSDVTIISTKGPEYAVPALDRICVTVLIRNYFYTPH